MYGCETCSLIVMKEQCRRVFQNRVLGRRFGIQGRDKMTGDTLSNISGVLISVGLCWPSVWNVQGRSEMSKVFWRVNLHRKC